MTWLVDAWHRQHREGIDFSAQAARALLPWLLAALVMLFIAVSVLEVLAPTVAADLNPAEMAPHSGQAYTISLRRPGRSISAVFRLAGDALGAPERSTLMLTEDGRALGPPHALHDVIADAGGGRYSHWGSALIFSSSDGSDPRTNGRSYRISGKTRIHPGFFWMLGVLAGLAGLAASLVAIKGEERSRRAAWQGWAVLTVGWALCIVLLSLAAPTLKEPLKEYTVYPVDRFAFGASLQTSIGFPFDIQSDTDRKPQVSSLVVLEDGRPLGPSHSLHTAIAGGGAGRFSHWGGRLLFSTSDNSDPRRNGRAYELRLKCAVHPVFFWLTVVSLAVTALLWFRDRDVRFSRFVFFTTGDDRGGRWLLTVVVVCVATAVGLVVRDWALARTVSLTVAGFMPLSDALGYWKCASELATTGHITQLTSACSNRLTYTALLASLMVLTDWHPHLIFVAQAVLIGIAVAGLVLQVGRLAGALGGLLVAVLLLFFADDHVLGTTMTEVAGFSAGCSGLALLLFGAERTHRWPIVAGLMLYSVSQTSRAGAMLILPALLLWAIVVTPRFGLRRLVLGGISVAALSIGGMLQFGLAKALHVDAAASFGNFSTVLYGLAVGGKGWGQIFDDHPEILRDTRRIGQQEISQPPPSMAASPGAHDPNGYGQIYALAFAQIRQAPGTFVAGVLRQSHQYWDNLFRFGPAAPDAYLLLEILLAIGFIHCLYSWRSPVSLLLLAMAAGEVVSAPLIADGGMRVFAGSIGLRLVFVALGLRAVAGILTPRCIPRTGSDKDASHGRWPVPMVAGGAGGAVVILAILPATSLLDFGRLPSIGAPPCPPDEVTVVTRIDRETLSLALAEEGRGTQLTPLTVDKAALVRGMDGMWFQAEFAALPPGATVIAALNRGTGSTGNSMGLFLDHRPDWLTPGMIVRICATPTDLVSIGWRPSLRVLSLLPLPPEDH